MLIIRAVIRCHFRLCMLWPGSPTGLLPWGLPYPYRSIVPEILKALWGQLGIPDGMLDVPMAEILLERPRVNPFIG